VLVELERIFELAFIFEFVIVLLPPIFEFMLVFVVVITALVLLLVTTAVLLLFVRLALVELTKPFDSCPPHAEKASDAKIIPNPKLYNLTLMVPPQIHLTKMRAFLSNAAFMASFVPLKEKSRNNGVFSRI
jgi:hypothetical protein